MLITVVPTTNLPDLQDLKRPLFRAFGGEELRSFGLIGDKADCGELHFVPVDDHRDFSEALRLVTHRDPGSEWGFLAACTIDAELEEGDVIHARFWIRCIDSMTGEGFTGLVVESPEDALGRGVRLRVGASQRWTECEVPFRAGRRAAMGQLRIGFRGGYDRQTIEIAGIELSSFGKSVELEHLPRTRMTYAGRSDDALWREQALERIEQIRKSPLTVRVVGADGRPVAGATVTATQTRHAFGFGSCVTVDQITGDKPHHIRARQVIESLFNRVVFENDMKWPAMWEGVPQKLDAAVDWLCDRGIELRGHNLHWPSWYWSPRGLRQLANDPAALRERCRQRVWSAVSHFRGRVLAWDVVNEPYNNVDLLELLGQDVMAEWFRLAHQADPDAALYINDFGIFDGGHESQHRRHYYRTIRRLIELGAPVHGVGIQSHFGAVMPSPANLLSVLDQFSEFGLPIESTEFSLNNTDEKLQSDYMRDYLIAMFSHPAVKSVILWGFWAGQHWRPDAALWTTDWQLRPHGRTWLELTTQTWRTRAEGQTNADGEFQARGFHGTYTVTVTPPHWRGGVDTPKTVAELRPGGTKLTLELPC